MFSDKTNGFNVANSGDNLGVTVNPNTNTITCGNLVLNSTFPSLGTGSGDGALKITNGGAYIGGNLRTAGNSFLAGNTTIGKTTNTGYMLDVGGTIAASGLITVSNSSAPTAFISNPSSTTGTKSQIFLGQTLTSNNMFLCHSYGASSDRGFGSFGIYGGSNNITFDISGTYLGGTQITPPNSSTCRLHVSGNTYVEGTIVGYSTVSSSYAAPDTSASTQSSPNSHGLVLTNNKGTGTVYSMALGVDILSGFGYINAAGNSTTQTILLQSRGGTVGIGYASTSYSGANAANPNTNYKLDVAGDINTTGTLRVNGTDVLATYLTTSSLSSYAPLASPTFTGNLSCSGVITSNIDNGNNNYSIGWNQPNTTYSFPNNIKSCPYTNSYKSGMWPGTGDGAILNGNTSTCNLIIGSWQGIGFVDTCFSTCLIMFAVRTGQINAAIFNATSDYRIKENIKPITNTIDNLKPIQYYNKQSKKEDMGFIAHELQEHFPFLVSGEKDGNEMQSINYTVHILHMTVIIKVLF